MSWKAVGVGLALVLAGIFGCQRQCFLKECDYEHYQSLVPENFAKLECDSSFGVAPLVPSVPTPADVWNPDRELRYITLTEALAIALEQGTVGVQSALFPGALVDTLGSFGGITAGSVFGGSDSVRALALDPAFVDTLIESSLSKFDARWTTSMTWTTTDRPVGTAVDTFQAAQSGAGAINLQDANFATSLLKPLPTGGVAGITFSTAYELSNLNPRVNPAYRPTLQFQFEQPLLQGWGVEINQLRANHPGSLLTPFQLASRTEGILITRLRFDEQRTEFERNITYQLVNVEISYWNLYGAYWSLYANEQALRQSFEAWKINKARYEAGRIPIQDFAQTRRQYEQFRGQRITALGQVLEAERQLRGLLGLPIEDGKRLVPADTPTLAPYRPDWDTSLCQAVALRPELVEARQDLKFRQLDLINQKNLLLPDLRFTSTYDINAIGRRLDGPDSNNAFRNLARDEFNNWQIGLNLTVPLGFRDAHAAVRAARLNLARAYWVLRDQEIKAGRFLELQYRHLAEYYQQIEAQRAQREAAAEELNARFKEFLAGRGTLDILLEAQRVWAAALQAEYAAIVQYNNALASFEFAKGTILAHDNVVIAEGPLPACAHIRAAEHERQRSKALEILQRPAVCAPTLAAPHLPTSEAPALPSVLQDLMPRPDMPEILPNPRPAGSANPDGAARLPAPVTPGKD
jgi:outer membrane protein TolC